ncbi:MAG: hypothetical protein M3Z32_06020, partial [Acidobacteriota bacterium]|nr:hypothetical protein [Acidobacteriota bacterium]
PEQLMRIVIGFLLGYSIIGLTTAMTHQLLYAQMVPSDDAPRTEYLTVITATDTVIAILGGWLCATVSREARKATLALVTVGEVSQVALALSVWGSVPHIYNFVHWIAYPFAVWLGARLGIWVGANRYDSK